MLKLSRIHTIPSSLYFSINCSVPSYFVPIKKANTWIEQPYKDAVMSVLGDLNVPIIFDSDIGHKGPQFSVIMGAKAKVTSKNGKGVLEYA